MILAEMVRTNREQVKMSRAELAEKLGVPEPLIACIERPEALDEAAVALFADALGVKPSVFTGQEPREPTEEEKRAAEKERRAAEAAKGRYPSIRAFILDSERCTTPESAKALFADDPFSVAERNVVLYLSTTALYHFCDTNTSNFAFERYLFKQHGKLLKKFEREIEKQDLQPEEKEERLNFARGDIFRCEDIENIAILILDDFAAELEQKLSEGVQDFAEDLGLPFVWGADEKLMKITVRDRSGEVLHDIKLLDVKGRT